MLTNELAPFSDSFRGEACCGEDNCDDDRGTSGIYRRSGNSVKSNVEMKEVMIQANTNVSVDTAGLYARVHKEVREDLEYLT